MEKDLKIVNGIMQAVLDTDEWAIIQREDPRILEAEQEVERLLDKLKENAPAALIGKLEDAIMDACVVYSDVGVLYGLRVAEAIRSVSANSAAWSQFLISHRTVNI